ncbi:MAG: ABC transporter transmembrane domain-containing protein, partial [Kineosporiaceae bacterium]
RVRRRIAARTQASLSDMTAITQETLSVSGILLAKVFNRQGAEIARFRAENERQVDLQVRQTMTGQSFFAVVQTFFGITPAIVYLVAGIMLSRGTPITAGTIVAFTTLQTRLLFPVVNLMRVALDVQTSLALSSASSNTSTSSPPSATDQGPAACAARTSAVPSRWSTCGSGTRARAPTGSCRTTRPRRGPCATSP